MSRTQKPDRRQSTRRQADKTKKRLASNKQPIARIGNTLLYKYEVTLTREIEHEAVVEVEAESEDVAKQLAEAMADAPNARYWQEQSVIAFSSKVKRL